MHFFVKSMDVKKNFGLKKLPLKTPKKRHKRDKNK